MQFYRINGKLSPRKAEGNPAEAKRPEKGEKEEREEREERRDAVLNLTEEFNCGLSRDEAVFLVYMRDQNVLLAAAAEDPERVKALTGTYLKFIGMELQKSVFEETTFENFRRLLSKADRGDLIRDEDEVLERLELSTLGHGRFGLDIGENLLERKTRRQCEAAAAEYVMNDTFLPEIDRIFSTDGKKMVPGHPVHYIVRTDDLDTRRESCRILLSALYAAGRIRNRRYLFMDAHPGRHFSGQALKENYRSAEGGAVIIRICPGEEEDEDEYAGEERDMVEDLADVISLFRHRVLTILCFPRECTGIRAIFREELQKLSFVELEEDLVSGKRAQDYLRALCRKQGVRADRKLLRVTEGEEKYLPGELHELFSSWFDRKLKTDCYPAYRQVEAEKEKIVREKPRGSAYEELQELIGLEKAKTVMKEALDYFKAQKLFAEKGMTEEQPSMHMVFTGNPGSAKTTVARLFARIMRENGILSKGHMVECGRGDLVGRFVGWTAKTVQKKFKEAEGGVLFIDEAYSLVDGHSGSFGDEAINTIVQEMENHRQDCVVIFAGYPEPMEDFLQRNPGLRSRISFHVPFEDYSTEELLEIAGLLAGKKGLKLTEGAGAKLTGIFEEARKRSDFGNGRFVRNILEQAKMRQASRLIQKDPDAVTREDIATLCEEDIQTPEAGNCSQEKRVIGFY